MVKLRFWQCTIDHVDALAIFEHHNGGNTANLKMCSKILLRFSINFHASDLAFTLGGNITKNRCEADTRVTPWCPKIDDDRFVALQQRGKIGFGTFNWRAIE
ncbi:Uncharacterised protein [Vibrio cholerae]|nr:Uncharacterised protein [Vibrio cholerae]